MAGGAEVHLKEVFSRIAARGVEVHLLSSSFRGARGYEFSEGVHIHRTGSRPVFNFFVPGKVRELEKRYSFDLLIEDLNKLPFYTMFYSRTPKKLAILHHLFDRTIYEETNPIAATYVYLQEKLVPRLYRDWPFVVVSESTKEDLVRGGVPAENVRIVYNGIDVEFFRPMPKYVQPTVLYLNRFRKYKRPDLAVRIFAEVKRAMPEARFLMAGKGPYLETVKRIASRLGVDVDFLGFVPEDVKAEVMAKSWVVLNTSSREGWGLVNMEAFASGTPVVGFRVHGMKDSVKDGYTGFLVNYGDVKGAAERVLRILKDADLRKRLSENARRFAEGFTWDRAAVETLKVIGEVI